MLSVILGTPTRETIQNSHPTVHAWIVGDGCPFRQQKRSPVHPLARLESDDRSWVACPVVGRSCAFCLIPMVFSSIRKPDPILALSIDGWKGIANIFIPAEVDPHPDHYVSGLGTNPGFWAASRSTMCGTHRLRVDNTGIAVGCAFGSHGLRRATHV
ncbi:hypothetical protein BC628DRAFT_623956 [Trametes gibbosa]|nr:hypothetical protein BC628DRAFT_623956 [Trametes gibbosa]